MRAYWARGRSASLGQPTWATPYPHKPQGAYTTLKDRHVVSGRVVGRENLISPWWFSKHFQTLVSTLSIWLIRICSVWKATKRSQRSLDRCWQQHPHLLTSSGMTCHPPDLRYRLRTTESILWTEEKEKNWGKRAKHIWIGHDTLRLYQQKDVCCRDMCDFRLPPCGHL